MQSGLTQSAHMPVLAQGVDACTRNALGGAAKVRTLRMASSTLSHSLFMLANTITCSGPWAIHATRLLAPSILTSSPALVNALVLVRK